MTNSKLEWDAAATKYLEKAPFFIRGLARRKVEKAAREQGLSQITIEFVESVRKKESGSPA